MFTFDPSAEELTCISGEFEHLSEVKGLSVHPRDGRIAVLKNGVPGGIHP
ncbi:hypothetical protein [Saccharothrix sp. ST-888]|nr:hypothetical protein [Saccharothrix sp. ST-888]